VLFLARLDVNYGGCKTSAGVNSGFVTGVFGAGTRTQARVLLAVASASIAVAFGVGGGAAAPTTTGALVFVSSREGESSLYVINADGSGFRRLVERAWDPRWSPEGRALAFFHDVRDKVRLEVLDADGSGRTRVVANHNYNFSALSWSPDGRQIAYEAIAQKGIYVTNADGSGERLLVPDIAWKPTWSPDATKIAFIRRHNDDSPDSLSIVNADGTDERRLVADVAFSVQPLWSPDGSRILYGRETCGENTCDDALYGVDADGSHEHPVTPVPIDDDYPAQWSPDGSLLAFVGLDETFAANTFIVRPDGGGLRLVVKGGAGTSWSPDGRSLAVMRGADIWTVAVDGSGRRRITQGGRYGYGNESPQWHPRGLRSERIGGLPVSAAIPTNSIAKGNLLRTSSRIHELAADGQRVALAYEGAPNCIELWQPNNAALVRFSENDLCGSSGLLELTLAGSRLAWLVYQQGIHLHLDLLSATTARPLPDNVLSLSTGGNISCTVSLCAYAGAGDLRGGGGLLIFDTWNVRGKRCEDVTCYRRRKIRGALWRVQGGQAKRIRTEPVGLTALAANDPWIAALRSDRKLEILRADGRLVRMFPFRGTGRAAIGNGQLVVVTRRRLLVYKLSTGSLEHRWPLRPEAATRTLAGVAGGFAALAQGRTIDVVRLNDGHRVAVAVGGTGAIQAALTSGGLFYAYTKQGSEYRGRVAFIPLRDLSRRFAE
jgi:Tol biopolymer transport system component